MFFVKAKARLHMEVSVLQAADSEPDVIYSEWKGNKNYL